MRLGALNPTVTPFKEGKIYHAGQWHGKDWINMQGEKIRDIFHYETRMLYFINIEDGGKWTVEPVSIGHGSVSDQQGVNQLLRNSEYYYSRQNNNARYVILENMP